ncbi:MAG: FHIPEP family type III secretion protein, partial [Pseudomonadota bacterium]
QRQKAGMFGIQIGYSLIELTSPQQGGCLLSRVREVRRRLSTKLDLLLHPVHIHDNLALDPNAYRIFHENVLIGRGEVFPGSYMATEMGDRPNKLGGRCARDPIRDCNTVWLDAENKTDAEARGWTMIDAASVVAGHLEQLVREQASVQKMCEVTPNEQH